MKKFHITLLFFLIWNFSFSQQYTNYTTKNGLPSNHIYRITQDYKGFIWFITDKGVVKYNGTTFKVFTTKEGLPTNDIWDIRITPDNRVWYFTKAAKLGYIENDKVFAFESITDKEIMFPVVIKQNGNQISFSNTYNLYQLKNGKWQTSDNISNDKEFLIHKNINSFKVTKLFDSLVILTNEREIIKKVKAPKELKLIHYRTQINDSTFSWLGINGYSVINLNSLELSSHQFKNKGKTFSSKFTRFNTANNQIQISGLDFVGILDQNYNLKNITKIDTNLNAHFSFIDKDQNLWMATFNNGIYFLPKTKQNTKNILKKDKVRVQVVDNKVIASIYNKGFYIYDSVKKIFNPFIKEKDFIYKVVKIDSLNTSFYITNKNIYSIKNKIQTKHEFGINETAKDLIYYNGYLYGHMSFGLNKINPKNLNIEKQYKQLGIKSMIKLENRIILATSNGLKIFENEKITPLKLETTLLNQPILSINKTKNNNLIVCTDGFGAYITDFKKTTLLEQSDYLCVQSAFIKSNEIWLATSKGVLHYKKIGANYKLKRKYTTENGLSTNLINGIAIADNNLITSSNDGISIIPLNQPISNPFFDIYFDQTLFNQTIVNNKDKIKYKKNNSLNVTISSLDFTENNSLNYSYQLFPIQKNWTKTTTKQIVFNELPPNKYQLNIKSKDKKSFIRFTITPLWYQTLFAKITFWIIGLTVLVLITLTFRKNELQKQTRKLNAQKKLADFELRALRSQMNPHFVFNSLNAIQYFITKNEIDLSEKYLVKFARLIRMFFDFSREKEIYITEEIKLLNGYLEIEKMRFGNDFNYKIDVINNLKIDPFKIPTMLLQPIVENAVNHGLFHNQGKGLIHISFNFITKSKIGITIKDNGVGLKKAKEIQEKSLKKNIKKDNSTNVIKERITLLNQTKHWYVSYKIEEDNGTIVTLTFTKNE